MKNQLLENDSFYRLAVKFAQYNIGTKNYTDTDINLNYVEDKGNKGCTSVESYFKYLTEDDNPQSYVSKKGLKTNNVNTSGQNTDDIGNKLNVFEKNFLLVKQKRTKFQNSWNFTC